MITEESLNEKIQQLETHYAERLAQNTSFEELSNIHTIIKIFRNQLITVKIVNGTNLSQKSI